MGETLLKEVVFWFACNSCQAPAVLLQNQPWTRCKRLHVSPSRWRPQLQPTRQPAPSPRRPRQPRRPPRHSQHVFKSHAQPQPDSTSFTVSAHARAATNGHIHTSFSRVYDACACAASSTIPSVMSLCQHGHGWPINDSAADGARERVSSGAPFRQCPVSRGPSEHAAHGPWSPVFAGVPFGGHATLRPARHASPAAAACGTQHCWVGVVQLCDASEQPARKLSQWAGKSTASSAGCRQYTTTPDGKCTAPVPACCSSTACITGGTCIAGAFWATQRGALEGGQRP